MSRDDAHPALHTPPIGLHSNTMGNGPEVKLHYVPEGWEDFDRGICPCGEVVVWKEGDEIVVPGNEMANVPDIMAGGQWVPDRTMRVLVLTPTERLAVMDMLALSYDGDVPETRDEVMRQLQLQDETEGFEDKRVKTTASVELGERNTAWLHVGAQSWRPQRVDVQVGEIKASGNLARGVTSIEPAIFIAFIPSSGNPDHWLALSLREASELGKALIEAEMGTR
jgi:hypothetical protein